MTELHPDYPFAEKICRELLSGNREAIILVHERYHLLFMAVARKRLYHQNGVEDLVNDFWIELLSGTVICAYKGNGRASLGAFLLFTLNWRMRDRMRKTTREDARRVHPLEHQTDKTLGDGVDAIQTEDRSPNGGWSDSPENALMNKQRLEVIYQSILELSERSSSDAAIIRLHLLEGLEHAEIAARLGKTESAVKKQYSRPRSGALAKFKAVLESNMAKRRLTIKDMMEG